MSSSAEAPRRTILVADDDEDLVGYLKFRLEREGYRVLPADDGDEALKIAREQQPDLAVIDVRMPRLDGFAVTRGIRANESLKDIPIILLTGNVEEEYVSQGYEAGATDYLTKPFSEPEELVARVRAALDRASGR
jgi:DNA-binding response OmpR family regulator